jgi:hypothetical protein
MQIQQMPSWHRLVFLQRGIERRGTSRCAIAHAFIPTSTINYTHVVATPRVVASCRLLWFRGGGQKQKGKPPRKGIPFIEKKSRKESRWQMNIYLKSGQWSGSSWRNQESFCGRYRIQPRPKHGVHRSPHRKPINSTPVVRRGALLVHGSPSRGPWKRPVGPTPPPPPPPSSLIPPCWHAERAVPVCADAGGCY